jgi:hypothetical protein
VVRVAGDEIYFKRDRKAVSAKLPIDLPVAARDAMALVIPTGVCEGDDEDAMRVIVCEPTGGLPRFHCCEAPVDRYEWFGAPSRLRSSHPVTTPATLADVQGRRRNAAAKRAAGLKQNGGAAAQADDDIIAELRAQGAS